MTGVCYSLLNFEPCKNVSWQSGDQRPSVDVMLHSISQAMEKWENFKSEKHQLFHLKKIAKEFEAIFIFKTCEQEDIGLNDIDTIRKIIGGTTHHRNGNIEETSNQPSYVETVNLCKAYNMLCDLRKPDTNSNDTENDETEIETTKGLLEIDACVVDIHKRLMKGLPMKTPAGQFSTDVRKTTAHGETHEYPKFETETAAADAVMTILDRYNALYFALRNKMLKNGNRRNSLEEFFKLAAWLFYNLVSLHPFGDGNGRLSRLVLNYVLESVFPFPIPLSDAFRSNSRDVYIDAIVSPRKSDGFPRQLTTLIIESTYHCSEKLLIELEKLETTTETKAVTNISGHYHDFNVLEEDCRRLLLFSDLERVAIQGVA